MSDLQGARLRILQINAQAKAMTNPPTVDIEEGQKLLAEATPGTWREVTMYAERAEILTGETHQLIAKLKGEHHNADAELIAWMFNHLPALLAKAREAEELREALRQANFFRDRLAERLRLVEAAILELDCALKNDSFPGDTEGTHQEEHWRNHVAAAVAICRRATLSVKSRPTRLPLIHHPETERGE